VYRDLLHNIRVVCTYAYGVYINVSVRNDVFVFRDVTKFEFEFDNIRTWNVELPTFLTESRFDECLSALLSNANLWKNSCSMTESQRVQADLFFSQIQPITQTTVIECAVIIFLSDVLNCANINTDFVDFRKEHIVTII